MDARINHRAVRVNSPRTPDKAGQFFEREYRTNDHLQGPIAGCTDRHVARSTFTHLMNGRYSVVRKCPRANAVGTDSAPFPIEGALLWSLGAFGDARPPTRARRLET